MRDLNHLRDLANRDRWGQEQEGWPENGHGMPGDDLNGRVGGDLPSGAKQLETEGAPDQAAYFNEPIPRPGGSGGQTAPDDGGPQEGYWRPSPDGANRPRGPGDLKDPRGPASQDGELPTEQELMKTPGFHHVGSTATQNGNTHTVTSTYTNRRTGETITYTTTIVTLDSDEDGVEIPYVETNTATRTQETRRGTFVVGYYLDSNGRWVESGVFESRPRGPRHNPNPNDDDASFWEMLDWARAGRTTWMLEPSDKRTLSEKTDEMVGQPGRDGAGGGAGSAGPNLGQDAVTNNGDSSFHVQYEKPTGQFRFRPGGLHGGGCITCE